MEPCESMRTPQREKNMRTPQRDSGRKNRNRTTGRRLRRVVGGAVRKHADAGRRNGAHII